MKPLIVIAALLAGASVGFARIASGQGSGVQGMLAGSKLAGACGIMQLQVEFQKSTKMPGGDDYIVRFWTTEAARLGFTMQQYVDACNKAIELHDNFMAAAAARK